MTEEEKTVSPETSRRICYHMNDDHRVTIYAMAKSLVQLAPGWKISDARMTSVSLEGCDIQVVTCRSDLCEMKKVFYQFRHVLESQAQLRKTLVSIHHSECAPKLAMLVHRPLIFVVVIIFSCLAWATLAIPAPKLKEIIQSSSFIANYVTLDEESAGSISRFVRMLFYFTVAGHLTLSLYSAYICQKLLKLSRVTTSLWMLSVSLSGGPVMLELWSLVAFDKKSREKKP